MENLLMKYNGDPPTFSAQNTQQAALTLCVPAAGHQFCGGGVAQHVPEHREPGLLLVLPGPQLGCGRQSRNHCVRVAQCIDAGKNREFEGEGRKIGIS